VNTNPANANFPTAQSPDREAAREERRLRRIAVLEQVCDINVRAAERLGKYIGGELSEIESQPFARLADPFTALTRLSQSIRRIVALQERLDEDDETREKRLKAERAARGGEWARPAIGRKKLSRQERQERLRFTAEDAEDAGDSQRARRRIDFSPRPSSTLPFSAVKFYSRCSPRPNQRARALKAPEHPPPPVLPGTPQRNRRTVRPRWPGAYRPSNPGNRSGCARSAGSGPASPRSAADAGYRRG